MLFLAKCLENTVGIGTIFAGFVALNVTKVYTINIRCLGLIRNKQIFSKSIVSRSSINSLSDNEIKSFNCRL